MLKFYFALLTAVVLFPITVEAQKGGTVRGFVYDEETSGAVLYTYVIVEDTVKGLSFGDITDEKGFFQISRITPGTYTLKVASTEYKLFSKELDIKDNGILLEEIYLTKSEEALDEVTIIGSPEKSTEVRMSMTPATKRDIQAVPMVGGTKDIVNYLTAAVPGAITTGDQGGQVYIRGGSPIQNKVLLDGMIIYNPFHSIGFFSVFDTDIIQTADIYTGGFNAEYGGRISSIMDIKTRDGNMNEFTGKVDVNPFNAKLLLEGPLWNNKDKGGSAASYVLSAKHSYLEQTSLIFYPYVNKDTFDDGSAAKDTIGLPFNFTDIFGKISINGANGSKFNIFGFNFRDQVNYQAISDLNWNSYGMGANFILVPQGSPVLVEGDFSFSDYEITLEEDSLAPRFSKVNGFNMGFDFTYFLGKNEIKYGIDIQGFNTDYSTFNAVGRQISQKQATTEIGAYVRYKVVSKNKLWVFDPSFRFQYYASLKTPSFEPRFGIKFNATENLRFKAAGGIYSQNLIAANSDRDVVNLFYGFLSGPDNLQDQFVTEEGETVDINHSLQKANHLIIGTEYDFTDKLSLNIEGYVKDFTQLTNINRNKIFEEDQFDKPDVLKKDFIVETGLARGIDLLLKYNDENLYLWAVYSIGKVDRWDGIQSYVPVFDRRHNVNLVGTYKWGKDKSWEMNHRWNFGTGFPFTQTAGFYQSVDFAEGVGTDYTVDNSGNVAIQYGQLNGGRLPTYHRYDLTFSKTFKKYGVNEETGKEIKSKVLNELMITAGVTNMYNRSNVFYVNRVTGEVVRQLPIMPSLGMSYTF